MMKECDWKMKMRFVARESEWAEHCEYLLFYWAWTRFRQTKWTRTAEHINQLAAAWTGYGRLVALAASTSWEAICRTELGSNTWQRF